MTDLGIKVQGAIGVARTGHGAVIYNNLKGPGTTPEKFFWKFAWKVLNSEAFCRHNSWILALFFLQSSPLPSCPSSSPPYLALCWASCSGVTRLALYHLIDQTIKESQNKNFNCKAISKWQSQYINLAIKGRGTWIPLDPPLPKMVQARNHLYLVNGASYVILVDTFI